MEPPSPVRAEGKSSCCGGGAKEKPNSPSPCPATAEGLARVCDLLLLRSESEEPSPPLSSLPPPPLQAPSPKRSWTRRRRRRQPGVEGGNSSESSGGGSEEEEEDDDDDEEEEEEEDDDEGDEDEDEEEEEVSEDKRYTWIQHNSNLQHEEYDLLRFLYSSLGSPHRGPQSVCKMVLLHEVEMVLFVCCNMEC